MILEQLHLLRSQLADLIKQCKGDIMPPHVMKGENFPAYRKEILPLSIIDIFYVIFYHIPIHDIGILSDTLHM